MSIGKGLRQVGYSDCPGGGQIVVAGMRATGLRNVCIIRCQVSQTSFQRNT